MNRQRKGFNKKKSEWVIINHFVVVVVVVYNFPDAKRGGSIQKLRKSQRAILAQSQKLTTRLEYNGKT